MLFPGFGGISSTSRTLSVRTEVLVVRRSPESLGEDAVPEYQAGTFGTDGTEDIGLTVFPLVVELGNSKIIFSSTVMLLVSLGCGLDGMVALMGGGGRGGRLVGLPGADVRKDFLPREPPDLLLL
jgi:hypothetical protein